MVPLGLLLTLSLPYAVSAAAGLRATPWTELFVVEEARPDADGRPVTEPVALVALRRSRHGDTCLRERDVLFREGGARLLLDELRRDGQERLIWRELRTSAPVGRTWMVERSAAVDASLATVQHGSLAPLHGALPAEDPAYFPLELLERLRREPDLAGPLRVVDPQVEAVVEIELTRYPGDLRRSERATHAARRAGLAAARGPLALAPVAATGLARLAGELGAAEPGLSTVELRRGGRLRGRFVLRGAELLAFQWQAGPRWARRIDRERYRELADEWSVRYEPLEDVLQAAREGRVLRR